MIRIDCYLGYNNEVLKQFKKEFPLAHFEIITRSNFNHVLSPSKTLLIEAGIYKNKNGKKEPRMDPRIFKTKFISELIKNPAAIDKLRELEHISKKKVVFLVCYEKDPSKCHRSVIKTIIENSIIWY